MSFRSYDIEPLRAPTQLAIREIPKPTTLPRFAGIILLGGATFDKMMSPEGLKGRDLQTRLLSARREVSLVAQLPVERRGRERFSEEGDEVKSREDVTALE